MDAQKGNQHLMTLTVIVVFPRLADLQSFAENMKKLPLTVIRMVSIRKHTMAHTIIVRNWRLSSMLMLPRSKLRCTT